MIHSELWRKHGIASLYLAIAGRVVKWADLQLLWR
jgi:hypothetical protein